MKKVLVTGADGFIGRHILEKLKEDPKFDITAVTINNPPRTITGCLWEKIDLLDQAKAKALIQNIKPDYLCHLAWISTPKEYWASPLNKNWLEASLSLLKNFYNQGGIKAAVAGTCAEYDWQSIPPFSEEKTKTAPQTLYGQSKHDLQIYLDEYVKKENKQYVWARIFYLYGPWEHPERFVAKGINSFLRGEKFRCLKGQLKRDYLFVEDVADAFVGLLKSDLRGPVNIGSGKAVPLKEIVNRIADKMKTQRLAEVCEEQKDFNEPLEIVADVTRLRSELKWVPKTSLDEGLDKTIEWWKQKI